MRILVDTNITLDYILERKPFLEETETLFEAIRIKQIIAHVTATTVTDIFYIVRQTTKSIDKAREAMSITLKLIEICLVDDHRIKIAFNSRLRDF